MHKCKTFRATSKLILYEVYDFFLFQSGEKPVLYTFNRQPSDMLMHRGAYGLSLTGIFISFYGVYLMVQDTNTKKRTH